MLLKYFFYFGVKNLRKPKREKDGGGVVAFLDSYDGLAGNADFFGKILLGIIIFLSHFTKAVESIFLHISIIDWRRVNVKLTLH